ncbi:MAG TPA: hypothetical protein VIY72_13440 [Acidimicrobiales bacterium]
MRIRIVVVALLLVVVAACGSSSGEDSSGPPPEPAALVELWLSATRVPPGDVELVAMLTEREPVDATFGVGAHVERWVDGSWVAYGSLVMCLDHWFCTAEIQPPSEQVGGPDIGLGATPEYPGSPERFRTAGLEEGWYRITHVANEGTVASGVFEVSDEAPRPAPLPAVDVVSISVQPALIPSAGRTVMLYPLVPPVNGRRSGADVEAVVDGLSESATLERWDGAGWAVAGGPMPIRPDPQGPQSVLVDLPALPDGAYRVVATGSGGPYVGPFWVDSSLP